MAYTISLALGRFRLALLLQAAHTTRKSVTPDLCQPVVFVGGLGNDTTLQLLRLSTASDAKSAPVDAQSRLSQARHTREGTDTPKVVSIQFAISTGSTPSLAR